MTGKDISEESLLLSLHSLCVALLNFKHYTKTKVSLKSQMPRLKNCEMIVVALVVVAIQITLVYICKELVIRFVVLLSFDEMSNLGSGWLTSVTRVDFGHLGPRIGTLLTTHARPLYLREFLNQ